MRKLLMILMMGVLAFGVAACGSAPAATSGGGGIQPSADAPRISPDDYLTQFAETDHVLVDVRTQGEVNQTGVISGATHIELQQLQSRLSELPQDATIVVYCNSGNRSRTAVNILANAGYENLVDLRGIQQWVGAGKELVPLGQ